ncbi:MAG: YfhO family protein [Geobacteraceae bacterium]|nr:YfhO family protein [Geobacteraceae bacterium]
MTERKKNLLALAALLGILILFFAKILFTDKIIRAPDIINEYYWSVLKLSNQGFLDFFRFKLAASWDIYSNSGFTLEGGEVGSQLMFLPNLIYYFFPAPASVAWFTVFHLFLGACGVFFYCRTIGASPIASFLGALIFAVAPENASLINAGHVLKIATISVAPWAFYFFEKGFQSRRLIFFMTTGVVLALQFFYTHWQIAYYTCLGIGVYGIMRTAGIILRERRQGTKAVSRLVGLNLVVMCFFLSTVAISLVPLANWSKETNRGVQSGANLGKGGLDREEAMSWSLPPEEVGAFVIPGMFGLSRQEGGENPANISSYYWGRMVFTQTISYMGLLPWLLLPLPLIFRRDRYTWIALFAVVGGIIFSMGKYTFVYNLLYDHFPGIDRFRVPKMMMFMPVLGLGVLAARGIDILRAEEARGTRAFRRYLLGLAALPALLLLLLGAELLGKDYWISRFYEMLAQPTRYEQGPQLVTQRWNNLVAETGIAAGLAALIAAAIGAFHRKRLPAKALLLVLLALFLADVGRIDSKFLFLVDEPHKANKEKSPAIAFLAGMPKEYRVLPLNEDPALYAAAKLPIMFISNPVQQVRWQNFLDAFSFTSAMPDMVNVKYVIFGTEQYEQAKAQLGDKYRPVFTSPDGRQTILENRAVLPKAWLVPAVSRINDTRQTLAILQNTAFDPRTVAMVESPPPFAMADPDRAQPLPPQGVSVTAYEGERIAVNTATPVNALLVLGEKYYKGWRATVDGKEAEIHPVNHILRGVYLTPGEHTVEFVFDPLPFKVGKYLTLASFAFFAFMLGREFRNRKKVQGEE